MMTVQHFLCEGGELYSDSFEVFRAGGMTIQAMWDEGEIKDLCFEDGA